MVNKEFVHIYCIKNNPMSKTKPTLFSEFFSEILDEDSDV